jgi:integrase/recombinase XerD
MRYRRCGCPIWVFGSLQGKRVRKSLETVNWQRAQEIILKWQTDDSPDVESLTMADATARFEADCEARKLRAASLGKYQLLFRELKELYGKKRLRAITIDDLSEYRQSWKLAPISSRKKLERLKTFFKFCTDRGWMRSSPALLLKPPLVQLTPTLPFSKDEIEKILWATEVYPIKGIYGQSNRLRIRAFVNLLRYSGLRIRDAVTLKADKLQGNKLRLYTQKTGQPVLIPLPESQVGELEKVNPGGEYFFWSGNGLPKSAVSDWQRSLAKLFKLAGIKGHAHKFRDTFSVSLLEVGVPLETVAVLLGNTLKVAEKHYAPWVKSRQLALESSIEKAWRLSG